MSESILLLHGALGTKEQFSKLIPLLESSFEVHTFDFSGHGENVTSTRSFNMETFAYEIGEYISNNKLKDVTIFGYSMGGYAALIEASTNLEIKKIFTLGTKFEWSPEIAAAEKRKLNPDKIEEKVPAFADFLAKKHGSPNWKKVVRNTAAMMEALGVNPLLDDSILNQIEIPVLVGLGDQDNMVSEEESKRAVASLDLAKLEILENTPHPFEQVNVLTIENFIRSNL